MLGDPAGTTYRTKSEAQAAKEKARAILKGRRSGHTTVKEFWLTWTTDPIYKRRQPSTNIHYEERTRAFAETYGHMRLADVSDLTVAEWIRGGKNAGTVATLQIMFNDAASAKAGRLITVNPFAGLGLSKGKGRSEKQPPTVEQVQTMVAVAHQITPPSFAAYFEFACVTAARPGELDALTWDSVRFGDGEVDLLEQFSAKSRTFTDPKYGPYTIPLVGRAEDVLLSIPKAESDADSQFVFVTNRGTHYTSSSRTHHWNRVRCAVGMPDLHFYLATRHHFAWYLTNVLDLSADLVAEQLGHKDGGKLVTQLYGHPDHKRKRAKVRDAYDAANGGSKLRLVHGNAA